MASAAAAAITPSTSHDVSMTVSQPKMPTFPQLELPTAGQPLPSTRTDPVPSTSTGRPTGLAAVQQATPLFTRPAHDETPEPTLKKRKTQMVTPGPQVPGQLGAAQVLRHRQPTLQEMTQKQKPYTARSSKQRAINRAVAKFITLDMRLLSIIEGKGFKSLVRELDPRAEVISRSALMRNYIMPMYQLTSDKVMSAIEKAPGHSFTTDAWTSSVMDSFVTTTAHFFDPDTLNLQSTVLDTHKVSGSHTGVNLATEMQMSSIKWGMQNVIGVSDNASNVKKVFEIYGIPHIGCAAHTLNLSVNNGLSDTRIQSLLGKVRALVTMFKTSYIKTELLHKNQKVLELKNLQLKQDVCTRWNSVYYMLDRLQASFAAVFASLYEGPNKKSLLTDEESQLVSQLVEVLTPFERASKKFSAEKVPTAGLILPYYQSFKKQMAPQENDLPAIGRVKAKILKDMENRYKKPEQKELLSLISALDPRVRSLDWLDEEERERVFSVLKEECMKNAVIRKFQPRNLPEGVTVKVEAGVEPTVKSEVPEQPVPTVDPDDDLQGVIFVRMETPKSDDKILDEEIRRYRDEPVYGLGLEDPMHWWRGMGHQYPNIKKVMLKYLHVPASSVPSERVFSTAGNILEGQESLDPDSANILIFLYHNFVKHQKEVEPEWSLFVG